MSRISIRLKELPENGENIPEIPAQDRVFQILSKRMMIAAKWARSPTNLKMFILVPTPNSGTVLGAMNWDRQSLVHLLFGCSIKNRFFDSQKFPNDPM